jgi:AraC-like DNA-binding protein
VLDAPASPHVRLRVWEAEAGEVVTSKAGAHSAVELAWIEEGEIGYGIGARQYDAATGTAMLVPSGVEHATSFPSRMRGAALWIDRDVFAEIADAVGCAQGPAIGLVPDALPIARLGAVLAAESKRGDRGALLAADAIAEAMIAIALRGATLANDAPRSPRDPAIASAVRYIEASYAEPLTVEGMARAAAMSRFHFSRRFRDATGRSPYRYLMEVRLERAAELLRRGRCGITEAALSVGLSDPSRFARMFRQRFGTSPPRWAAAARARVLHALPLAK